METVETSAPSEAIVPMNGSIQRVDPAGPLRPTTPRARIMAEALKEATEQRALLKQYISEHMVTGTDYGVIPGTQKPTLLKPGEKAKNQE